MPKDVVLPELAESVVEGEVTAWLVEVGSPVSAEQPLVEVMTDKVTVELPSPYAGVRVAQVAAVGDVVRVGAVLGRIDDGAAAPLAGDAPAASGAAAPDAAATAASADDGDDHGDERSLFRASAGADEPLPQVRRASGAASGAARGPFGRVVAVPAARRLARELGLPIERVEGSGPHGRVRVADVERQAAGAAAGLPAAPRYQTPNGYAERERRTPLRGVRRVIAQQLSASHLHTVRTLHVDEADVSALVRLRATLKPRAEARGVSLSYLPFVMRALVHALRAYPALNSSLDEAAGEVVEKDYVNLGMAVATDAGLVVPVIRDADARSIMELAAESQRLAAAAREGRLAPDEVHGSSFTLTNIGSIGGLFSFPIINAPDAAILGVHTIKKRPVVLDDDSIVARPMLYLSLSFDHRLVDGAEAARFSGHLIDLLQTPEALLLDA